MAARARGSWFAGLILAAGLAALAAGRAAGPLPATAAVARPEPGDSVLARIGARRQVTVGDFRRSWDALQPPERPDSLTPETAREFLDLLAGKEALAERALRTPWVWTRRESLRYDALRDQLTLRAALAPHLDRARDSLRRAGLPADDGAAGVAARDRFVASLRPDFDPAVLARLAAAFRALPKPTADSGLFGQLRTLAVLPRIAPADSALRVATTARGPFRAGNLLAWWANVNPALRPRVETAEQVRELAANALFERQLRREAAEGALERRPDIVAALAREREAIAVEHEVEREVYETLPLDSTTLRRFFESQRARWGLPTRVRVVRLEMESRAEAERMGARLRDRAEVERLIGEPLPDALPNLATPPRTRFVYDVIERDEPRFYREALRAGPGVVIGPDSTARGWSVARIVGVIPARLRTWQEARAFVAHDWQNEEGERRMRALLERARRETTVRVNPAALRRIASR